MNLREKLRTFRPHNSQEEADCAEILWQLDNSEALYHREFPAHLTASAWVVSPDRTQVLMAYHNLYNSWAWLGGHADGETDLLSAAMREVREESGLEDVRPVSEDIFSVEVLTVEGHVKRGAYVPSHLHLNVTYLLEADEEDELHIKPDENSGVRWFALDEAVQACSEPWMRRHVYAKLNRKLLSL